VPDAFVGAPFPAPDSPGPHAPALGCRRARRFTSTPSPCGGGWVGCTTESCGCSGGRPRRGGTPVRDETAAVRVLRDWLWSRRRPLAIPGTWGVISGIGTWAAPLQLVCSDRGGTPAAGVPFPLIMNLRVGPAPGVSPDHPGAGLGVEGRDHSQSRGTGSNGLLENGRAPASGTAAHATPRFGSAPHPATPARRRSRGEPAEPPARPGSRGGRRATRAGNGAPTGRVPDQTDTMDRHDRAPTHPAAQAPDRRRARSELSVVHGCSHDHEHPKLRIMEVKIASIGSAPRGAVGSDGGERPSWLCRRSGGVKLAAA
jgi:hypothetical protein